MAYSPTAIYDENNLMIKDGLSTENVKKTLSGLADGSLEIGQNGIRPKAVVAPEVVKAFANNKQGRKAKKDYKRQVRAERKNSVIGINQEKMQVSNKKHSILKDVDGESFVDVTEDIFDNINGESIARTIQRVIAERFNNLITANGQIFQINKTTNDEFRRSNSANHFFKNPSQAYNDKLKTVAVSINGKRGNIGVVVQKEGKNKYHVHRILMPDGSKFVYENIQKNAEPTVDSITKENSRKRLSISSASNNSISQKNEKSTPMAKKSLSLSENPSTRDDNFDADEFLRTAMENGGMIEKREDAAEKTTTDSQNSQTTAKKPKVTKTVEELEAENKELKKANRGLKKANERLAESVSKTQQDNRDKRREGRALMSSHL